MAKVVITTLMNNVEAWLTELEFLLAKLPRGFRESSKRQVYNK